MSEIGYALKPIGFVRSPLASRKNAPRQGYEGAPEAWIDLDASVADAMDGMSVGDELIIITWLHMASRDVLKVYPRGDRTNPLTGVFLTRSPDRPNPLGLHRVDVLEISGTRIKVARIEAIDGTPVVDIKPVLPRTPDA